MTGLCLDSAAGTNRGHRRVLNEDALWARQPVFMVADGMGGHDAGDRASSIAIAEMKQLGGTPTVEDVRDALARARRTIDGLAASDARHAAGTTVSGVVLVEQAGRPYWLVFNLGDSRTYHMAHGRVEQVSVDHSEVQELLEARRLDGAGARGYGRRNVITRVLGARTQECPEYWLLPVETPERWLVCSDGLTQEVSDDTIARILTEEESPQGAVEALIDAALTAGGRDNVTVIVINATGLDPGDDEETIEDLIVPVGALEVSG